MKSISMGKYRGMQQCTSPGGTFTCLALDHRQNLRKANPLFNDDHQLSNFKLEVTSALAGDATAVLLDPEFSAAQAISAGALPGGIGLVVAVESTGYSGTPTARNGQVLPGWSVEKAKRMGASMIKLLVYYHPKSPTAEQTIRFVQEVATESLKYDLGLMIEPLSYSLTGDKLSSQEKHFVVVETARHLTPIVGVDVLKAELPLDASEDDPDKLEAACSEVSTTSFTPWILLSAAVSFEKYQQQVVAACRAGASGIAVGRAVWQEAISLDPADRPGFLQAIARERFRQLRSLCVSQAKPVTDFYRADAPLDWYKNY